MSLLDEAVEAYNAQTGRDHARNLERANALDTVTRVRIASTANERLRLSGHDEVVWSDLESTNVGGTLVYHFTTLGYQFIGYIERNLYRFHSDEGEVVIQMRVAPWASIKQGSYGLYAPGYDRIDGFESFGEAILVHMYEHQMPDRLQVALSREGLGGVLDDLWNQHIYALRDGQSRIDIYEAMLPRYRSLGGRGPTVIRGDRPEALLKAETPSAPKKRGFWVWNKA